MRSEQDILSYSPLATILYIVLEIINSVRRSKSHGYKVVYIIPKRAIHQ